MAKYQKTVFYFALLIMTGNLLYACKILSPPEQPQEIIYDMGIPEKMTLPENTALQILPFTNSSAAGRAILLRTGENTLIADDFHLWSQMPAQLLTQYLRSVFQQNSQSSVCDPSLWILSGTILAFEGNTITQEILLSVQCVLTHGNTVFRLPLTVTEPFSVNPQLPDYVKTAEAMPKAMQKLAE